MHAASEALEGLLTTGTAAVGNQEFAAATAALAERTATDHNDRTFLLALCRMADAAMQLGRNDVAFEWLQEVDLESAASPDPAQRQNLAAPLGQAMIRLGRNREARERLSTAYTVFCGRFPAAHPNVQIVRRFLAQAIFGERDHAAALPLQQLVVATQRQTGREDHELLEDLRLLAQIHHYLGQRQQAHDLAAECLAIARKLWPADHAEVLNSLEDFAATLVAMGDYRGSYELSREALAIRSKTLPAGHPNLIWLKQSISQLLLQLADLEGAMKLQSEVLADLRSAPVRDEAMYLTGLQHHARLLFAAEDYAGARQALVEVIDRLEGSVAEQDRDLNTARELLGCVERRSGALAESRALLERAFAGLSASLPRSHNTTQIACADLITTCRMQGDLPRAVELTNLLLDASVESMQTTMMAARPTARLVALQDKGLTLALSLALDDQEGLTTRSLLAKSLLVSQWLGGFADQVARQTHRLRTSHTEEVARIAAGLAAGPGETGTDQLAERIREKERLELELLRSHDETADPKITVPLPTLEALARSLPPDAAAVATIRFTRRDRQGLTAAPWLAGLVLLPGGELELVDLGNSDAMREQVDAMDAGSHKRLRSLVIDPLLRAAGEAKVLYLALDDMLQLVPWDSLPLPTGAPVGSVVELRRVGSLLDLMAEKQPQPTTHLGMVAIGGVDYANRRNEAVSAMEPTRTPPLAQLRGNGEFVPLQGSRIEMEEVAASFKAAFPDAPVTMLSGAGATKPVLAAAVPGVAYVHFATHGYIAYNRIEATTTSVGGGDLPAVDLDLAPFALCGLALSGANLGPDATGRSPGLLSAEELQHFDLGDCHLATLSACESAMGAWSRGQGFASLHQALHNAGARYVVSTLWPVTDVGAQKVMTAFYRELWQAPDQPYRALWKAKHAAKVAGLSFHDWAAFQLSGT